ncbi:hypothetical protein D3C86_2119790 [compost metagenome]
MDGPDARRLRELEAENSKLKKQLAEVHLNIQAVKTVFEVERQVRKPNGMPLPP